MTHKRRRRRRRREEEERQLRKRNQRRKKFLYTGLCPGDKMRIFITDFVRKCIHLDSICNMAGLMGRAKYAALNVGTPNKDLKATPGDWCCQQNTD